MIDRTSLTWGDIRAFHAQMESEGRASSDDLLATQVFQDRATLNPADDELVFAEAEEGITYSFTFDENQERVLELVKADEVDGVLYVRDGGDWVVTEEAEQNPTVFEVPMQDIDPASVGWAINFWDNAATRDQDVTIDEVAPHLI